MEWVRQLTALVHGLVDLVAQHAVAPMVSLLHLDGLVGDPHEVAGALLIGATQILIILCVLRPLEAWWPAERWDKRKLTTVDRRYTLLMLLFLNPLFAYLVLMPIAALLGGGPDTASTGPEGLVALLPVLQEHPLLRFGVYYIAYDFTYYWMHRAQHWMPWWWALHSMHHSQRQMSCWTNDRGSWIDGALQSFILAGVGLVIGVDADEFALLMLVGEVMQSLSHTNMRFGFGRVLDKLLVDPKFHRLHHMVVDAERPRLHDCNYGQVFSVWDRLFGTALYGEPTRATGVADPVVDADNGRGMLRMQWGAFKRFAAAVTCRAGWIPGDVAFAGRHMRPVRVHDPHDVEGFLASRPSGFAPVTPRGPGHAGQPVDAGMTSAPTPAAPADMAARANTPTPGTAQARVRAGVD